VASEIEAFIFDNLSGREGKQESERLQKVSTCSTLFDSFKSA